MEPLYLSVHSLLVSMLYVQPILRILIYNVQSIYVMIFEEFKILDSKS